MQRFGNEPAGINKAGGGRQEGKRLQVDEVSDLRVTSLTPLVRP